MNQNVARNSVQFLQNREISRFSERHVHHFLLDRISSAKSHHRVVGSLDVYGHFGCINALDFSRDGLIMASGGDDKRVLVWNTVQCLDHHFRDDSDDPRCKYVTMEKKHESNIFCLSLNCDRTRVCSGGNDEQVLVHDLETKKLVNKIVHEDPIYACNTHPKDPNLYLTASSDGLVLLCDHRLPETESFTVIASLYAEFFSAVFNPTCPYLIATANSEFGITLWDSRKSKQVVMRYGNNDGKKGSAMSVTFDDSGTRLFALRPKKRPVLFDIESPEVVAEFDAPGYYNGFTMKSCSFAGQGQNEFVLSGSDDFRVYGWKVPERGLTEGKIKMIEKADLCLEGHRSIPNQVKFNNQLDLIATSGVEKIIKIWSGFSLHSRGDQEPSNEKFQERRLYTRKEHQRFLREEPNTMHNYNDANVEESPRMISFFDKLVQRKNELFSDHSEDEEDSASPPPPLNISSVIRRKRKNLPMARPMLKSYVDWSQERAHKVIFLFHPNDMSDNECETPGEINSGEESNEQTSTNSSDLEESSVDEITTSDTSFNVTNQSTDVSINSNSTSINSSYESVSSSSLNSGCNNNDISTLANGLEIPHPDSQELENLDGEIRSALD